MIKKVLRSLGIVALIVVFAVGAFVWNQPQVTQAVELTNLRTATSRTIDNGNGSFTWQGSQGTIHYRNAQGNWQPIDTSISANGTVTQDAINFRIIQNRFNFGQIIEYSVNGTWVRLQPMNLDYTNDLNQIQPIASPANVVGTYSNSPAPIFSNPNNKIGKVNYANAYGNGINMSWSTDAGRIRKEMTIASNITLPTPTGTTMSGGNPVLRLSFIFAHSTNLTVYLDGVAWNEGTQLVSARNIDFRLANNTTMLSWEPAVYFSQNDSGGTANTTLRRSGQNLYVEIRVPVSWLSNASYPVIIDPSASVQVGANADDSRAWMTERQELQSEDEVWVDDVLSWINNGNGEALGAGVLGNGYRYGVSLRMPLSIAQGVTIDSTNLTFRAVNSQSGTTINLKILAHKTANSTQIGSLADYQARRGVNIGGATNDNITAANVSWNNVAATTANTDFYAPEIKTIIQELVNQPAFNGGYINLFVDDHIGSSTRGALRDFMTYEYSTTFCPRLVVNYSTGGASIPADDTDLIMFLSLPLWSKN
jgi:hypothetical protein